MIDSPRPRPNPAGSIGGRSILAGLLIGAPAPTISRLAAVLLVAVAVAALPPLYAAGAIAACAVVVLTLVRPDYGLMLLALAVPFGSLVEDRLGSLPAGPTELLAGLVAAGWLARVFSRPTERVWLGPLFWPIFLFLGVAVFATSFARQATASVHELLRWLELLLAYLAATNALRDEPSRRRVAAAVLVAASLEALLGFVQFFTQIGPPSYQVGRFLRAYGTFGQPNPYGGYLAMVLPLALALTVCWGSKRRDWLWWLSLSTTVLTAIAVVMSLSRGAWLGLVLACALVAYFASRRAALYISVAAVVTLLVLILGSINLLPSFLTDRLFQALDYFRIFDARGVYPSPDIWAIVERMAHWQAGWEMFLDYPFTGVGPGNYPVVYPDYAILPYWSDPLGHAHNIYINIAAETGLFGLLAYLGMLGSWVIVGLRAGRRLAPTEGASAERGSTPALTRAIAVGVVACVAAAGIHNLFDNLYVHGMNVHIGLLLGLMIAGRATDSELART